MYFLFAYQRKWNDNEHEVDCNVGDCIREKHPESIHAFVLKYPDRSPIGFKVLTASRSNCNEESHDPHDDGYYCDPADNVKYATMEESSIKKADGDLQKSKGYRVYQIESSLQLL